MQQQYWVCLCGVDCLESPWKELAWKVNKCCQNQQWYFAQSGELHPKEWGMYQSSRPKAEKKYDIAKNVQKIYLAWLKKDETIRYIKVQK